MAICVRKKSFKKAVDRNRIKRLTREVFRLNQHVLVEKLDRKRCCIDIFFVYTEKKILSFHILTEKFKILTNKLGKETDTVLPI
jgi:ribonuclease P protein component